MKYACVSLAILVGMACSLAACSGSKGAAADPAPQSAWLAVAQGQVDVEGGLVQVAARANGIVESISAKPGAVVKAGQVLAKLDPRAAAIKLASTQAGVAQAKAQLAELQVSAQQARQQATRLRAAAKAGAATGAAAAAAEATVATLTARQAAAKAALDVANQQVAAAQLALAATSVRAPVAGSVVARHVALGQAVVALSGPPLFELLPGRPHIVRAQVDATAASAIRAGMHADVVRDSGSGPVYQATVLWVGQVLQPASLTQDPLAQAVANDVACTLQLAPAKAGVAPLRIGQRVLVRFPRQ